MPDPAARAVSTAYRVAAVVAQRLPARAGRPIARAIGRAAPLVMPAPENRRVALNSDYSGKWLDLPLSTASASLSWRRPVETAGAIRRLSTVSEPHTGAAAHAA